MWGCDEEDQPGRLSISEIKRIDSRTATRRKARESHSSQGKPIED